MSYRRLLAMGWAGFALLAAPPLSAQPYLVKNINEPGNGISAGSEPEIIGVAGDHVILAADDEELGRGMWATDGTSTGTRLLIDVSPGPFQIFRLGIIGDRLLFNARGQVWSTDGTPAGTVRLTYEKLGQSGPYQSGHPIGLLTGPPRLLFTLYDPDLRDELWVSDGTPGGTHFVVRLGAQGPGVSLGGELLFVAGFGQLWRSDGTRAGTAAIRGFQDIVSLLTRLDDERAVFVADDGVSGREIWVSDGTAGGTRLVADLRPGAPGSDPFLLRSAGGSGHAFFLVDDAAEGRQLWRTDGTSGGTFRLAHDLEIGFTISVIEGLLFATANDGVNGWELLVSDGTVAGTRLLDLCPGSCSGSPTEVTGTTIGFLFTAFDPAHGHEPWLSDGTMAGSRRVGDLCPGVCDSSTALLADLGGRLVLLDPFTRAWVTDGTAAGSRQMSLPADLTIGFQLSVGVVNGVAVFNARDTLHGEEPWRTDGTEVGTFLLRDLALALRDDLGSNPASFARLGDEVFFAANSDLDRGLWRSDGTEAGTRPVGGLDSDGAVTSTLAVGSDLFVLTQRDLRRELWRTDGTAAGTVQLLADDLPIASVRRPVALFAVGDRVYVLGPGLWRSGRSPGTAQKLATLVFEDAPAQDRAGALDGRLYFGAAAGSGFESDFELWSTDGTPGGTRRVRDILPGSGGSRPREFFPLGDRLFFNAFPGLWRTDGTDTGTELVLEFDFVVDRPRVLGVAGGWVIAYDGLTLWATDGDRFEVLGDSFGPLGVPGAARAVPIHHRLYFVAEVVQGSATGGRLWSTDGTAAGTGPVAGGAPAGHSVVNLFRAGDELLLLVENPFLEQELWVTDGTLAGRRRIAVLDGLLVYDFGLFGEGTPPIALGDQLLFNAFSPAIGEELWAVDLDSNLPPFGPPEAPCDLRAEAWSESGVRLSWRDNSEFETSFLIAGTTAEQSLGGSISVAPGTRAVIVQGLPPETPFTFTVAAVNTMGTSAPSNEASAAPLPEETGPCVADAGTLCLLGGRFAVSVLWRDQHNGGIGTGGALPFPGSDRTGLFWFFDPANVELIVKALDGREVNGAFWSFYGALSDVEYWVTVVDTARRRARTYHNRPGEICGVGDTGAFPEVSPLSEASASRVIDHSEEVPVVTWPYTAAVGEARSAASERGERDEAPARSGPAAGTTPESGRRWRRLAVPAAGWPAPLAAAASGSCTPGPEALCLLDGRLRVEVLWHDHHNGGSGTGKAVPGTDKAGFFWFFNQDNVELVVKALDGTPVNGYLWVFYGALSDVEYTITVTDTASGLDATYHNPPGEICGDADTQAF